MDGWDIMLRKIFPFSRPLPQLDFSMYSGRPLAHSWRPWASKWLTFASPWFTFGTFWLPFVSLSAAFGSLWLTFGTLFDEIIKTFINSILFHEFARLVNTSYEISCFSQHKKMYFRKHPLPPWPGAEPCRRQPRSAPGPKAPRAC